MNDIDILRTQVQAALEKIAEAMTELKALEYELERILKAHSGKEA